MYIQVDKSIYIYIVAIVLVDVVDISISISVCIHKKKSSESCQAKSFEEAHADHHEPNSAWASLVG